jgi:hypothetical protein
MILELCVVCFGSKMNGRLHGNTTIWSRAESEFRSQSTDGTESDGVRIHRNFTGNFLLIFDQMPQLEVVNGVNEISQCVLGISVFESDYPPIQNLISSVDTLLLLRPKQ